LKSLNIGNNSISDTSFIEQLVNLKSLDLRECDILNVYFLKNLPKFQKLYLGGLDPWYGRERNSHKLIALDTTYFENLQNLKTLHISNYFDANAFDFSFLAKIKGLESLELPRLGLTDISFLRELTGLHSLNLKENCITDISGLKKLTNLQSLNLERNEISNVHDLGNLASLQSLNLYNNQIVDVSALEKLTSLHSLNIIDNQIIDITSLAKLKGLKMLKLSKNQIENTDMLVDLVKTGLSISGIKYQRK